MVMTERSVAHAGIVAAAVSGALCAAGYLAVSDLARLAAPGGASPVSQLPSLLPVWLLGALLYGVPVGLLMGILPTIAAVGVWSTVQRWWGARRAGGALCVLVALIGVAELSVGGVSGEDVWWLLGVGAVCGLTSAVALWFFGLRDAV